jgi:hypothetical protein
VQGATTVSFGADVTVNSVSVLSATQLVANISINGSATTGARDVTVTNPSPVGGTSTLSGAFTIDTSTPTGVEASSSIVPMEFALHDPYPNPFNPGTTIRYELPRESFVSLRVFNVLGREVALLFEGMRPAGVYIVSFDASKLVSGSYFYRLQARPADGGQTAEYVETKRMILLR